MGNRRFGFRRYKNLLHRNRHHPNHQIRVKNNPYTKEKRIDSRHRLKERSILCFSLEIARSGVGLQHDRPWIRKPDRYSETSFILHEKMKISLL